jgi:hypothetical protein
MSSLPARSGGSFDQLPLRRPSQPRERPTNHLRSAPDGARAVQVEDLVWAPPALSISDWVELFGLVCATGDFPAPTRLDGYVGLPLATRPAADRAVLLSLVHRLDARLGLGHGGGTRRYVTVQLAVVAGQWDRLERLLRSARTLWHDGPPTHRQPETAAGQHQLPRELAQARWRAALLSGAPGIHRDGSHTVRAANERQAQLLVESARLLGVSAHSCRPRREAGHRVTVAASLSQVLLSALGPPVRVP